MTQDIRYKERMVRPISASIWFRSPFRNPECEGAFGKGFWPFRGRVSAVLLLNSWKM